MAEDLYLLIDGVRHAGLLSIEWEVDANNALFKVTAGVTERAANASISVAPFPPLTPRGAEAKLLAKGEEEDELLVTGWVRRTYGDVGKPAMRRFLYIESKACDVVESAADGRKHGYRLKGKKLGEHAKTLYGPYKVPVTIEADSRTMDIAWQPGQRAFAVIEERARKAGLSQTGSGDGGVVFYKGVRGRHAGEFITGGEDANSETLQYEDSEIGQFSETHYYGQRYKPSSGKDQTDGYAILENEAVRRHRIDIQRMEHDFDQADMRERAEWDGRRAAGGDAGNGTQVVIGTPDWRDPDGRIWMPAYARQVLAPDVAIDQLMAIKTGRFTWSKDAQLVRLTMVDPRTIGGKDPKGKSGKAWDVPTKKAKYEELA